MEGSVKELSRYRFRRAEEEFCTADILLGAGQFKASINRSYYSIFHALRSVTALDHFDSGKHSGVITYFNRHYIKDGVFDKSLSKMIDTAYRLRENSHLPDSLLSFPQVKIYNGGLE
ncbi:MAG: HEPN domain-containing protein [Syntrophaceticus schinkii]|jgi:uncharacterized protein (UPF0332 family)|nr:HEPN domain-containing protein [Syntrophaceticus schinkii]MDD4261738.1 HEPN domain-containing protein [Syntrophaceticus schinkii]MDD4675873.1 HEPN domain-containing protein [Syntrophaceticus schinkii]